MSIDVGFPFCRHQQINWHKISFLTIGINFVSWQKKRVKMALVGCEIKAFSRTIFSHFFFAVLYFLVCKKKKAGRL